LSQNLASSLVKLNPKERIYVENRLAGLSQVASATAAGYRSPGKHAHELEKKEHIQAAMLVAMSDLAEEVGFTRKDAHDMLMTAYTNAATSAEQIQAVKEMINLHGIAAPKVIEVEHNHKGSVSLDQLPTADLIKLAGMESLILEGEFEDVTDDKNVKNARKRLPKV